MRARKYSLSEIDSMRDVVEELFIPFGGEVPKAEEVEARLRTYMFNGTEPNELWDELERIKKSRKLGKEWSNL